MSAPIKSPETGTAAAKRAYWRSRRGMSELEQILLPFVIDTYAALSAAEQDRYEALLDEEDWDIFDWVQGRSTPPAGFAALITTIAQHQRRGT